ncbi:MAG TPA: hypothetical protein VNO21_00330 [Polyangiaceae bacterium]|nr:hypothetical protein [Polyangiaceae bacterium]
MVSIDMVRAEHRARLRYEWGRVRRALIGFAPILILVGGAVATARHRSLTACFGLATFVVGVAMLWYGRDLKRAVLPGIAAGAVPLVMALCASHVEHGCIGDGCMMLCVPACTAGGVIAGLAVSSIANARHRGVWFWVSASGIALLTGAMGCACPGYLGVVGLAVGYGAGLVPSLLRRVFARLPTS